MPKQNKSAVKIHSLGTHFLLGAAAALLIILTVVLGSVTKIPLWILGLISLGLLGAAYAAIRVVN